jgi:hypothetical protein
MFLRFFFLNGHSRPRRVPARTYGSYVEGGMCDQNWSVSTMVFFHFSTSFPIEIVNISFEKNKILLYWYGICARSVHNIQHCITILAYSVKNGRSVFLHVVYMYKRTQS